MAGTLQSEAITCVVQVALSLQAFPCLLQSGLWSMVSGWADSEGLCGGMVRVPAGPPY